jgi:hypothetical protein
MQINELEASGSFTWVELKNTGDASEPLDGYSIQVERISSSDQTQRNFAFRFESGAAAAPRGAAGSIVVVCFGGFSGPQQEPNCDSPGRNYCSNTCAEGDLDQDGGVVSLLWRPPCQVVTPWSSTRSRIRRSNGRGLRAATPRTNGACSSKRRPAKRTQRPSIRIPSACQTALAW